MSEDDTLGDFEEFGNDSDEISEADDMAQNDEQDLLPGGGGVDPADGSLIEPPTQKAQEGVPRDQEDDEQEDEFDPTDNPLGIDPRPGKWDLCFDRAKPGAKVYVVDVLAESVEEYQENYEDAPELDSFEGNVVTRMRPDDRVLAAIYVDQSLTSTPDTAYPMPSSRLTRVPAEEASLIGNGTVEFARPPVEGDESEEVEDA